MKTYDFEVKLDFGVCGIEAKSKKSAIKLLKEQFLDQYNLELKDEEIEFLTTRR